MLIPSIALALAVPVLDSRTATAELVAGGWLTPPPIPKVAPPPPRRVVPVVPVARKAPPPRPRPAPQRQAPAPLPYDGKVRF
ncbi:MAG: hypothetical protein AB7H90_20510 [Alphaproteobacteria bacterium]